MDLQTSFQEHLASRRPRSYSLAEIEEATRKRDAYLKRKKEINSLKYKVKQFWFNLTH